MCMIIPRARVDRHSRVTINASNADFTILPRQRTNARVAYVSLPSHYRLTTVGNTSRFRVSQRRRFVVAVVAVHRVLLRDRRRTARNVYDLADVQRAAHGVLRVRHYTARTQRNTVYGTN